MPGRATQSYLLRLWRDPPEAPWRATVVLVAHPDAPQHFASLDALFAFLLAQTYPASTAEEGAGVAELDNAHCTPADQSPPKRLSQGETP